MRRLRGAGSRSKLVSAGWWRVWPACCAVPSLAVWTARRLRRGCVFERAAQQMMRGDGAQQRRSWDPGWPSPRRVRRTSPHRHEPSRWASSSAYAGARDIARLQRVDGYRGGDCTRLKHPDADSTRHEKLGAALGCAANSTACRKLLSTYAQELPTAEPQLWPPWPAAALFCWMYGTPLAVLGQARACAHSARLRRHLQLPVAAGSCAGAARDTCVASSSRCAAANILDWGALATSRLPLYPLQHSPLHCLTPAKMLCLHCCAPLGDVGAASISPSFLSAATVLTFSSEACSCQLFALLGSFAQAQ